MHTHEMTLQSDLAWALHCAEEQGLDASAPPPKPHSDIWTQQSLARDQAWRQLNICSALLDDDDADGASPADEAVQGGSHVHNAAAPPGVMSGAEASAVLHALQGRRRGSWWGLGLEGALQVGAKLQAVLPHEHDNR